MGFRLWHGTEIVALDVEGSGAQDRDTEAILEVAIVPLAHGRPDLGQAFTSLVNPGRPIPQRPWLSPGLTNAVLAEAPPLEQIAPRLIELVEGRWVVGHNINVDWRLLSRYLPSLRPAGLLDTLLLARALNFSECSLSTLVDSLRLHKTMQAAAGGSRPHRAYWDTVATAHLLPELISRRWPAKPPTFESLRLAAGVALPTGTADQPDLFG
ncbi:3'-5' exonuclease [Micromonospora sp. AMSO12t]|uniref:3'-5' exonuclease n=2 Tax=unclassified Micromonospora TaxID=2617518 RepID=UPI00124B60EF|nr:3'-5' exonuclease [Micromonospora sp. AMSO12t]KAB1157496.1 3'-5' exonuclease [Micromonospora sp. AMSO12t]